MGEGDILTPLSNLEAEMAWAIHAILDDEPWRTFKDAHQQVVDELVYNMD